MESVTYVNEIDIRKIATGQPVVITLDSDPSKQFTGKVTAVANVGEQRPNADAKVFEVKVKVDQPDTTLRPGMTTGNAIETYLAEDALFVPIEALNSEDGVAYVFRQSGGGMTRQEVVTGAMNEDEVIILEGLTEEDHVLLSPPAGSQSVRLERLPGSPRAPATAGGDTASRVQLLPPRPDAPPRN
jgi:hypothetical protein